MSTESRIPHCVKTFIIIIIIIIVIEVYRVLFHRTDKVDHGRLRGEASFSRLETVGIILKIFSVVSVSSFRPPEKQRLIYPYSWSYYYLSGLVE
ncbi:hypothetical protein BJX76DRAFT_42474 [Aspergillus varians]